MPRAGWAKDDAPEARVRAVGIAVLLAQANERIFTRHDDTIGVCSGHCEYPDWFPGSPPKWALPARHVTTDRTFDPAMPIIDQSSGGRTQTLSSMAG